MQTFHFANYLEKWQDKSNELPMGYQKLILFGAWIK